VGQSELHQVKHAEGVAEAAMVRPRIGQVTDPKLVDTAQALYFGRIQQLEQPLVGLPLDADVVLKRIPKDLGGHSNSISNKDVAGECFGAPDQGIALIEPLEFAGAGDRFGPVVFLPAEKNKSGAYFKVTDIGFEQFLGSALVRGHLLRPVSSLGRGFQRGQSSLRILRQRIVILLTGEVPDMLFPEQAQGSHLVRTLGDVGRIGSEKMQCEFIVERAAGGLEKEDNFLEPLSSAKLSPPLHQFRQLVPCHGFSPPEANSSFT
jgi:hypothetical protein